MISTGLYLFFQKDNTPVYKVHFFLIKMKLVLIGPQGSGKGTQAKLLSKKLKIPHISTGDLLRNATGELRKEIDSYIVKGELYPDEKMLKLLETRIKKEDCKNGFILDGFPRNLKQARMLEKITKIDRVVEIYISDEEAVRRLSGRVACEKCGAGFNYITIPPKEKGKCDKCGGKLVQRDDDKEEAIRKRLKIYHEETEKILKHYKTIRVNGEKSIEEVQKEILRG